MGDKHLGQNFNASKEKNNKEENSICVWNQWKQLRFAEETVFQGNKKDRLEEKLSNGIERYGSLAVLTFLTQLWANLEMTVQAADKLQLMTVGKL